MSIGGRNRIFRPCTGYIGTNIGVGSVDVVLYIKSIPRGFGNGNSIVHGEARRNSANAHYYTPGAIGGYTTCRIAWAVRADAVVCILKGDSCEKANHSSHELAEALHGEDGSH